MARGRKKGWKKPELTFDEEIAKQEAKAAPKKRGRPRKEDKTNPKEPVPSTTINSTTETAQKASNNRGRPPNAVRDVDGTQPASSGRAPTRRTDDQTSRRPPQRPSGPPAEPRTVHGPLPRGFDTLPKRGDFPIECRCSHYGHEGEPHQIFTLREWKNHKHQHMNLQHWARGLAVARREDLPPMFASALYGEDNTTRSRQASVEPGIDEYDERPRSNNLPDDPQDDYSAQPSPVRKANPQSAANTSQPRPRQRAQQAQGGLADLTHLSAQERREEVGKRTLTVRRLIAEDKQYSDNRKKQPEQDPADNRPKTRAVRTTLQAKDGSIYGKDFEDRELERQNQRKAQTSNYKRPTVEASDDDDDPLKNIQFSDGEEFEESSSEEEPDEDANMASTHPQQ
ncbi:hypothetical protein BJ508DRAFT_320182 [Ascobolus immersus RN42]|uniref:Uncharacterized protein n=1 Tax=Ascobolus immersus RN42 TaxID=1160509 RepID=A0A3N4IQS6_ASCIM|nr:hypothetical protein BJ508DRAFT_320182 [Ascobolus immersus RN42]